jgi:hypothetical protein
LNDPVSERGPGEALASLIEDLRRVERRRIEATPGSSEYIEVVGFERRLVERISEELTELDRGPYWSRGETA